MYDPGEQLSRAVNDLRAWAEARLRRAGSAVGAAVAERLAQAAGRFQRPGRADRRSPEPDPRPGERRLWLLSSGQLDDELTLRLVHTAGGRSARVRVLAGLEVDFAPAARRIARQFARFGVEDVVTATVATRVQAEDEVRAALLREADLVVLAADDPRQASRILAGSVVGRAIREAWEAGRAVALVAAAAWLAGDWALPPELGPGERALPGLGLLPGVATGVAGEGWGARGIFSFLRAIVEGPATIERGLWLEPEAASFFGPDGVEAWGRGALVAVNAVDVRAALGGAAVRRERVETALARRRPATLTDVALAFAPPGYRMNLAALLAEPVEGVGGSRRAREVERP